MTKKFPFKGQLISEGNFEKFCPEYSGQSLSYYFFHILGNGQCDDFIFPFWNFLTFIMYLLWLYCQNLCYFCLHSLQYLCMDNLLLISPWLMAMWLLHIFILKFPDLYYVPFMTILPESSLLRSPLSPVHVYWPSS